ncbi:30S ribosomal protein S9 [Thermoflexus sp.]|uniref:30S ribosomal protein S9 n=1 Tax=Thermoflexus sp. TaxID=1969742 RepID=UPI0035E3F4B9
MAAVVEEITFEAFKGRNYVEGVGRRKRAVARVRLYAGGSGIFIVNNKPARDYFAREQDLYHLFEPLRLTGMEGKLDVTVKVEGGGLTGQAGAIRLGLARALVLLDSSLRPLLKQHGMLTRDPREKERKKPGLRSARKAPQSPKR